MWLLWTLLACVGFGAGAALQKHGVATALPKLTLRRLLVEWRLVLRTMRRNWVWLVGVLVNLAGGGCLVLAIDAGEVSVVQPLVNVNLLVSVLIGVLLLGERLRPGEWAGAAAMLAGATLVSLSAGSAPGGAAPATVVGAVAPSGHEPALLALSLTCGALVAALLVAGRVVRRARSELVLAVAAGLLFGLGTPLIKLITIHLGEAPPAGFGALLAAVAAAPATWGVVVVNVVGFLLYQVAFANGRVAVVSPVTTISAVVMPVAAGALAFGEPLGALRVAGVVIILAGVGALLWSGGRPAALPAAAGTD